MFALGLPLLLGGALHVGLRVEIARQQERNHVLDREIARIDARIPEIKDFERRKEHLLEHMDVYQQLRRNVHKGFIKILPDLSRRVPEGTSLTRIHFMSDNGFGGQELLLVGEAMSNDHVRSLVHALSPYPLSRDPEIRITQAASPDASVGFMVKLVTRVVEDPPEEEAP